MVELVRGPTAVAVLVPGLDLAVELVSPRFQALLTVFSLWRAVVTQNAQYIMMENVNKQACIKLSLIFILSHNADVNECALNRDNCAQNCINTNGGFRCSCRTGYSLLSNGYSCAGTASIVAFKKWNNFILYYSIDINECAANNGGCAHNCQNTVGSFRCSCRTGYTLSSNGRSCNGKKELTYTLIVLHHWYCFV